MSRIGKLPISIPQGVEVNISETNIVTVKGKLGTMVQTVDPCIKVMQEGDLLHVSRQNDTKREKSLHGLYRSLIHNMVMGVSEGFHTTQEVIGVGYKAQAQGQVLELALGYSHSIFFELPQEIKVETITEKGKSPIIKMTCCDKQLLGQVASKIRSLRKPEPYKGKGIRFQGEIIRKKAGKAAAK